MIYPICAIHGVTYGGVAENTNYANPLFTSLNREGCTASMHSLVWADLAMKLSGRIPDLGLTFLNHSLDYIVDVLTYHGKGADEIQSKIRSQIEDKGPGVVVVAHSLGSVVIADCILRWIITGKISHLLPRSKWPVSKIISLGSPLGINVPGMAYLGYTDRAKAFDKILKHHMPKGFWVSFSDLNDPIVTGSILGLSRTWEPLRRFKGYRKLGVSDRKLETGYHIASHLNYWGDPDVIAATHKATQAPNE